MTTLNMPLRPAFSLALLMTVVACGSILNPGGSAPGDTSKDFEPPPSWEAGFQFHFADSTWKGPPPVEWIYGAEVAFFDGRRERILTGRDLFYSSSNSIRTPWSRLWPSRLPNGETTVRVTIADREGNRSVAEYPIRVGSDEFYWFNFHVYTRVQDSARSPVLLTDRSFDVPAGAKRLPSDSLWIGYVGRPRSCFNCPF